MSVKRGVLSALFCASLCAAFGSVTYVAAEDVTVSIGVGDTILEVKGETSPNAFITIKSDDTVIGTTIATADGAYSKTFSAQSSGLRKLSLSAHTTTGLTTHVVTVNLSVIEHALTTVEAFLPTTVTAEDTSLDYGQSLQLQGETAPSSAVKIFLDNTEYITTSSDADGNWKTSIDTRSLTAGGHEFFVRVIDAVGTQSYSTVSRSFTYEGARPLVVIPKLQSSSRRSIFSPAIVFPVPGATWSGSEIVVKGKAPKNAQIELWDGERLLGSAWSDDEGNWSIQLILEPQEYSLRTRTCIDNQCSDFSSAIPFTHHSPTQEPQEALRISASQTSFVVSRGETLSIQADMINGHLPYQTKLDWGDKGLDSIASTSDRLSFSHAYSKIGRYTVLLEVQDAQGQKASMQFSVYVQNASLLPLLLVIPSVTLLVAALPIGKWLLRIIYSYRK